MNHRSDRNIQTLQYQQFLFLQTLCFDRCSLLSINSEKKEIRKNVYIREIACINIHIIVILYIKSKDKNHVLCTVKGLLYH